MGDRSEAVARLLWERLGREPEIMSAAPGRVNLIGEHTDYNGGFVLPAAIDRRVTVAAAAREDVRLRVYSLDYAEDDDWPLDGEPHDSGGWRNYVRGPAWALARRHPGLRGADIAITGDVPQGAGLSSSAAVEVAVAGAIAAVNRLDIGPRELALAAHTAENDFAGVECGIMDQFASALGEQGHALLIDCRSLIVEPVPLHAADAEAAIVVIDSMTPRQLGGSPYAERRRQCRDAAELLGLASLRDADGQLLEERKEAMPETLYRRARHVISEDGRVLEAVDALRRGDLDAFGRLMYESHESLRDDFDVSTPELDRLVEIAGGVEGVFGARLTGAGFGGSIVVLARHDAVAPVEEAISSTYRAPGGRPADVHVCRASDGLKVTRV